MRINRTITVITALTAIVIMAVAFTVPGDDEDHYSNLKVLPKNISSKNLSKIMVDEFADELGVSCSFCHAEKKGSTQLDYASDEKSEKQMARAMMRMTISINKKYFGLKHAMLGDSLSVVTCGTCHRGQAMPDNIGALK